jgi:hypothetical protein
MTQLLVGAADTSAVAVHGWKKREKQDPILAAVGVYTCSDCGRPLEIEMVVSAEIDREDGTATGFIEFQHFCRCDVTTIHETRAWGSYPSFLALFGKQPSLPYRAPFTWQEVSEDDRDLARWRWELSQVADWDEFMLFAEDAANRDAA